MENPPSERGRVLTVAIIMSEPLYQVKLLAALRSGSFFLSCIVLSPFHLGLR